MRGKEGSIDVENECCQQESNLEYHQEGLESSVSKSNLRLSLSNIMNSQYHEQIRISSTATNSNLNLIEKSCNSDIMSNRKQFIQNFAASLVLPASIHLQSQPALATYIDAKTKINLPLPGEVEEAVPVNWEEIDNPFINNDGSKNSNENNAVFKRLNNANDAIFYKDPRFVEHVDEKAVNIMQTYIQNNILADNNIDSVLDLCSSWTSHIDRQTKDKLQIKRIAGLGMNEEELKANAVLTDYTVLDLNSNPNIQLPYDDSSFDVVLCQLSIDYLIHPLTVMKEVGRVLKKKGKVVILFSNRLFLEKAVGIWTGADDIDHTFYVASYIYFSNGGFQTSSIQAQDLSIRNKKGMIVGDPMYAVTARKQ